ncbi:hypothetical protein B9Z55_007542 [Caenorhabditis nigoni]|uniref:Uncharacterized protein n=1 Tax=Caenorhabditis nigoni TaxID=1611254 RepID=A0A2G5VA28_9PELO|nr:hypothetical protein B9Z55_007542 [Caenorhabditis nigoni]
MLEIGGQQFHGRHDTSKLHPIKLTEELSPHLTHEEVDEIEKNFAEMDKELDNVHRMKLRKSIGIDWGFL